MSNLNGVVLLMFVMLTCGELPAQHFQTTTGTVSFVSEAPLEIISAESTKLKGIIDPSRNTFAFSVPVISFEGFNSPLQREHFNENYMETNRYPEASFRGKIIEQIDFSEPGLHEVRSKGELNIHGVISEVIIRSALEVRSDEVKIHAEFDVVLDEHDIKVPKIVNQKIASVIRVTVDGILVLTTK